MTLHIDPAAVRAAWRHGADADSELLAAQRRSTRRSDLGAVTACLDDAAADLDGVLDVCRALVAEHGDGIESCLAAYAATDHQSAGEFDALTR